jgi:TatA/E family protein of Tat protein translocase
MGIESPVHLVFIAVIALVVLGPKRLPDLAKALGQGIREFRESLDMGAKGPESSPPPAAASIVSAPAASSVTPAPTPPVDAVDATTPPAVAEVVAAAAPATTSTPAPAPVSEQSETVVSPVADPAPQPGDAASSRGAE